MSHTGPGATPLPKLTHDGIRKLMDQLDADLAVVNQSAATGAIKGDVELRISHLKSHLRGSLNDSTGNLSGWVSDLAPQFAALTKLLVDTLGPVIPKGACSYNDGECIMTTAAQCDRIGGAFHQDVDCP